MPVIVGRCWQSIILGRCGAGVINIINYIYFVSKNLIYNLTLLIPEMLKYIGNRFCISNRFFLC